ncbi:MULTISPECIES: TetR/AcrR family transcriptional regulator [Sphingobium]|uniref:TetR/AcrR family transcriptional regulator n=1 Tax=Sphingobium TaxID=165695 RepID=UPI000C45E605|nr:MULTISPECIES: TetR/AcrR family transcriptional regulator [Sphingobium]MBS48736.1 TetR family transcriptional regulator [Sphingobium sp.]MCC4258800.1 TetR/AcrR family transcriptional regulator [Sphingobium lactosutens]MEC9016688.1 TetR/AcrR family transcriptional regulator [Pseudomonadota bacterium]MEE2740867.1 TetR/AcrR family transcriptional regulator [Pseudomonadota bacterium]
MTSAPRPTVVRLDQIVEATRILFVRHGYRRTSMDDIAREAGVAKATLYLHFSGKVAIFAMMLDRCQAEVESRVVAAETSDAPLSQRLRALLYAYFGVALEWFGDAEHLSELKAFVAAHPDHFTQGGPRPRARIQAMLDRAEADGDTDFSGKGLSTAQVANVLVHAARGAKLGKAPTPETFRRRINDAVSLALAGGC